MTKWGEKVNIRLAENKDYVQLAEMKWLHAIEDDIDYGEKNTNGVNKDIFISEFCSFLNKNNDYKIFVAEKDKIIVSAMFLYIVPKVPKPNGKAENIAYLTNVFTRKEYRNQKIGAMLLSHIKKYASDRKTELLFVWASEKSVLWYERNGFVKDKELMECCLMEE